MNYSETNAKINLKFNSAFIKGSIQYKNEIDNKFFNKLIMTKLCRIENEYDNNHKSQQEVVAFNHLSRYNRIDGFYLTMFFNYHSHILTYFRR